MQYNFNQPALDENGNAVLNIARPITFATLLAHHIPDVHIELINKIYLAQGAIDIDENELTIIQNSVLKMPNNFRNQITNYIKE